jgi:3-hydroxyisobutyrate dehydrogenase-like beta-hydroxyacid dehydrogenase
MKIAVLGAGRVGSTVGKLWHAAGHDVTFAARSAPPPPPAGAGRGAWGACTRGLRRRRRGGR